MDRLDLHISTESYHVDQLDLHISTESYHVLDLPDFLESYGTWQGTGI
jgi:hypothetical protein